MRGTSMTAEELAPLMRERERERAATASPRLLRCACILVFTSSAALSALWSARRGDASAPPSREATAALRQRRDARHVMRDRKPLESFFTDDGVRHDHDHSVDEVVEFPALYTKYAVLPAPDGQIKTFLSWNGGLQAPTRRLRVNQTVRVTLVNDLYSDGVTVHHHGVHQIGTPYYDGTAQIAQPVLAPGRTMTYEFVAWPPGTHWYHSHSALQAGDGLKGLFIVENPDDAWKPFYSTDEALMFYEWNWRDALDSWETKSTAPFTPQDFETGVVNGVVSKNASGTNEGYVVHVGAGRTVRLRLCYAGVNFKIGVSIAAHNFTVIAKDGTDVSPLRASKIIFHAAERYDFLVEASLEPGDYAIRFEATVHGIADEHRKPQRASEHDADETLYAGHWNATLRVHPVDRRDEHASHSAHKALPSDVPHVDVVDLSSATNKLRTAPWSDSRVPETAQREIPLVVTARFPYVQEAGDTLPGAPAGNSDTGAWMINNASWVDPTAPLYLTKGKCCVTDEKHYRTNIIDVHRGEVIDLVVVNNGLGSTVEDHPLHLHGYKFWVVASGELPFDKRRVQYNTVDPVHADTFPIRTGYYYVLRLRGNNPGMWHLHCHLLYHMFFGLQAVLNVGESFQPMPPEQYFRDLESWPNELKSLAEVAADAAEGGGGNDDGSISRGSEDTGI